MTVCIVYHNLSLSLKATNMDQKVKDANNRIAFEVFTKFITDVQSLRGYHTHTHTHTYM